MKIDISAIIASMTLEEKAALCTGATAWTTTPIDRLGVPEFTCSDGPHGVRRQADVTETSQKSLPATCFPTASCLASSWDVDLVGAVGRALGEECVALKVDMLLGPGTNMKRSPLGGRNFEYFSEDPFLAGELAASFIDGVQSKGVGTSLKHYAANNQEYQRFTIDAKVDERTLREIYLPAFEKAVKKSQPWSIMCSYNKVNGVFASEQYHLMNEILKSEWGFEGLVVSDWGAVRDRAAALNGGTDWDMPGPQPLHVLSLMEAVKSGKVSEADLNESARRILRIVFMAAETPKQGTFDADGHHELAARVSAEGMVLLKNNGILPLKDHEHIAVIGNSAVEAHFQGGGSSHINPTKVAMPFNELKARAGNAELSFATGYPADDSFKQEMIDQAVEIARGSDVAILYIALPSYKESEGYDRKDLDLTVQQIALIKAVSKVQPNCVVVLNNGSPVAMSEWIDGVGAVLEAYMMGQAGGSAIADVLYGRVNPSGKLAETFPMRLVDTPAYINWPGGAGSVNYGEGIYIGYRYYERKQIPVLFPFGFGLSYTTFEYSDLKLSSKQFDDKDGLTVEFKVTNTGKVAGKEIAQIYVHDQASMLDRPEKELKGFAKVELKPGETKVVKISLDFRAFAYYHPEYQQWITEDGEFTVMVGASSADIRLKADATLRSTLNLPCILDKESTIKEWLADARGNELVASIIADIVKESRRQFGLDDEEKGSGLGSLIDGLVDMPLVSVMLWNQKGFEKPAEIILEELLLQVHSQR